MLCAFLTSLDFFSQTPGTGGCETTSAEEKLPGSYFSSYILRDHYLLHWYAVTPNVQLK